MRPTNKQHGVSDQAETYTEPSVLSILVHKFNGSHATRPEPDAGARSRVRLRDRMKAFLPFLEKPISNTRDGAGARRSRNQDWIDLDHIRGWLAACDRQHGHVCQLVKHNPHSPTCSPAWLIDVEDLCLIRGKPGTRYFALSYVWGPSKSLACTEMANLALLQQRGALEMTVRMPKTIAHAVGLTKLLGERYLWADRFCIVQDNSPDKQAQLDGMGDIFAGAFATIIAATGSDADHGLTGIPGVTSRRKLRGRRDSEDDGLDFDSDRDSGDDDAGSIIYCQSDDSFVAAMRPASPTCVERLEDGARVDDTPAGDNMEFPFIQSNADILVEQARVLMRSTWYSRGWTFQEHMFSGRKIIFQDETVNWECSCAAWHEAQAQDTVEGCHQEQRVTTARLPLPNSGWPDLHRFARLISLYNRRLLTYPEDCIDAFGGVITSLNRTFVGGFVSGLPQMFFDSALLWQPHRPLQRRLQRGPQDACLPSWSWVGWHGTLNSESWRSGYDYLRKNADEYHENDPSVWQPVSWHTTSTVSWSYVDGSGKTHVIDNCGHRYRGVRFEGPQMLPEGWTRHICEESGRPFFRHDGDQAQGFWYPIPLRKETDPLVPHARAKYLSCTTRSAVLDVGETFHNDAAGECLSADLVDGQKNWIGVLRYPFAQCLGPEPAYNKHELIELSAGSVLDQETEAVSFEEWSRPGRPRENGKYEFYNVMAIRRDDLTAYRVALGRVEKAAWERLATQEIDVRLG